MSCFIVLLTQSHDIHIRYYYILYVSFSFYIYITYFFFFFFQAEDGIRDHCVTGVQTCALPISRPCRRVLVLPFWSYDMSRKSAERKHDQTADQHQRNLITLIKKFSYSHHTHTVFADFVEMAAISISNAIDRTQFDLREKRYLDIVRKYSKEE